MTTLAESLISSTSRPLTLRMRPDLSARRHRYHGRTFWVVKEPVGLNYFRFHEEEYAILGMLDGEYGGEYWFDDKPVHKASVKERGKLNKENIGFVFQHFHLLDDLTVYENLEIPLSYRDVSRKEREARVAEILDRFQMVGKKDLYPTQLSGGQQQQVAVARAVIAHPRIVLADEPTGSLHWSQGEEIMKLLKGLNENGTTILQVSHDERVAAFGRRLIELGDGWISSDRKIG